MRKKNFRCCTMLSMHIIFELLGFIMNSLVYLYYINEEGRICSPPFFTIITLIKKAITTTTIYWFFKEKKNSYLQFYPQLTKDNYNFSSLLIFFPKSTMNFVNNFSYILWRVFYLFLHASHAYKNYFHITPSVSKYKAFEVEIWRLITLKLNW